jgi:hypothetical protein
MKKTTLSAIAVAVLMIIGAAGKIYSNCATLPGRNDGACQKVVSGTSVYYQCVPAVCNATGPACSREI